MSAMYKIMPHAMGTGWGSQLDVGLPCRGYVIGEGQNVHRLLGARDPRCGADAAGSEVVGAGAEELVANVERVLGPELQLGAAAAVERLLLKVLLAHCHAP